MTVATAESALIAHLQSMPNRPNIAYVDGIGADLPRIVLQEISPAQSAFGTDGSTKCRAEIQARIETAEGDFGAAARSIYDQLMNHFKPGLTLDGAQIREAPSKRGGYNSGGVFHLPVIIRGELIF